MEVDGEIHVYQYNLKKIRSEPVFVSKVRATAQVQYLMFLKDGVFGVFYAEHLVVYQIDDSRHIRQIFNKKYGIADNLTLMQIPAPI